MCRACRRGNGAGCGLSSGGGLVVSPVGMTTESRGVTRVTSGLGLSGRARVPGLGTVLRESTFASFMATRVGGSDVSFLVSELRG